MSIKLGRLVLLVAIEGDFEAVVEVEVEIEIAAEVEVEVDENLAGLGEGLIALVGTGLGSPLL